MKKPESVALNIDCMEYMATLPDKAFELSIIDPPYGIERFKRGFGSTRFKNHKGVAKNGIEWDIAPDKSFFDELFRVSKNQIIYGISIRQLITLHQQSMLGLAQVLKNQQKCLGTAYTNITLERENITQPKSQWLCTNGCL